MAFLVGSPNVAGMESSNPTRENGVSAKEQAGDCRGAIASVLASIGRTNVTINRVDQLDWIKGSGHGKRTGGRIGRSHVWIPNSMGHHPWAFFRERLSEGFGDGEDLKIVFKGGCDDLGAGWGPGESARQEIHFSFFFRARRSFSPEF
jgi:hypothetical protein